MSRLPRPLPRWGRGDGAIRTSESPLWERGTNTGRVRLWREGVAAERRSVGGGVGVGCPAVEAGAEHVALVGPGGVLEGVDGDERSRAALRGKVAEPAAAGGAA